MPQALSFHLRRSPRRILLVQAAASKPSGWRGRAGRSESFACRKLELMEVDPAPGGGYRPADRAQDTVAVGDAGGGPEAEGGRALAGVAAARGGGGAGPGS